MEQKKTLRAFLVVVAIVLIVLVIAVDAFLSTQTVKKTDYAMGSVISMEITGKNPLDTAEKIVNAIDKTENTISWRIENSEIAKINKNGKAEISDETEEILKDIIDVCKKSGGKVDLTVGRLTRLWNIGSENFSVPKDTEIKDVLSNISYSKVSVSDGICKIGENQALDLGFIGKGLACDKAKEILVNDKAKKGIVNVGGSLCFFGDGKISVGLRNPLGDVNDFMAIFDIGEGFVSTSGNYERVSVSGGEKYHHILSIDTGYPVKNDLLSVTVFCDSGLLSDALSTAVYCLGYDEGIKLLESFGAEGIFLFNDKTVRLTDGFKNNFKIENNEFKLWKES